MSKTVVEVHKKHLKETGRMKLMFIFTFGRTISQILKIYFLGIHGKLSLVLFRATISIVGVSQIQ